MTERALYYEVWSTPIGRVGVATRKGAVVRIHVEAEAASFAAELAASEGTAPVRDAAATRAAREQLDAYLAGEVPEPRLVLASPPGTPFQKAVWHSLCAIPRGSVRTYGWLARRIGHVTAVRAVGQANRRNPLPLVVPCHRVVQSDGRLGGYAGDKLSIKAWLLRLEGCAVEERLDGELRVASSLAAVA